MAGSTSSTFGIPRERRGKVNKRWVALAASPRRRAPRRLRLRAAREHRDQRALDRRVARRREDLRPEQIGHVEHVDRALAEGRDVRRGDVEVELGQRGGELVEQAGAVEAAYLDHGVAVRPGIVDVDLWLDREGLDAALRRRALLHPLGQLYVAVQRALDRIGDADGAPSLVVVELELARHRYGVEREPVGGGEDLRVDDVGAGGRAGAGDDREQPGMGGGEPREK